MKLDVYRYSDNRESTLGLLFIDGCFECYTLEDEARSKKVFGETRIPSGSYTIKLRTEGGHHSRYAHKFSFHKGMLWLQDVPNFKWILIHIGNTDNDTAGCLLVGNSVNNNTLGDGKIGNSTEAYINMYKKVVSAMDSGEPISISYHDKVPR